MLSQPILKLRELNRSRLNQSTGRETANPVVGNAQEGSYLPMPADRLFNRFPSFLDSFFNIHGIAVLTL